MAKKTEKHNCTISKDCLDCSSKASCEIFNNFKVANKDLKDYKALERCGGANCYKCTRLQYCDKVHMDNITVANVVEVQNRILKHKSTQQANKSLLKDVRIMINAIDETVFRDVDLHNHFTDAQYSCINYFSIINRKLDIIERSFDE